MLQGASRILRTESGNKKCIEIVEEFYEHIDDYKNGLLAGNLLARFENAMTDDASLKLAIDNYDTAKSISESLLEVDMMNTLSVLGSKISNPESVTIQNNTKSTDQKYNRSILNTDRKRANIGRSAITGRSTTTSTFRLRNFMAAASLIGIIFFTGWWMTRSPYAALDTNDIIASYIKPSDNDRTKSIVDKVAQSQFIAGKKQFNLRYYKRSELLFQQALVNVDDMKEISEIYMWLGASYAFQGEVENAVSALKKSNELNAKDNLGIIETYLQNEQ